MSAKNRKNTSKERDEYPTPQAHIDQILHYLVNDWSIKPTDHILEPSAGDGRIVKSLIQRGYTNITAIDIAPKSELVAEMDFFRFADSVAEDGLQFDVAFTNPPFSLSEEFALCATKIARKVIFLQRLNWLGSKKRNCSGGMWEHLEITDLYVHSTRPSFDGCGSDACDYGWYVMRHADIIPAGTPRMVRTMLMPPIERNPKGV